VVSIVIHVDALELELVMGNSVVKGSVSLGDHLYRFAFPLTESCYEIWLLINCFTGELLWQHGGSPFGILTDRNVHRKGLCNVRQR
jgi:hypothetical protein